MEIEEDRDQLRMLFHACDVNNSGRIEKEDFLKVCSELRVQPIEVEAIFSKLDADRDGSINFEEFSSGFRGVSELVCFGGMESGRGDSYALAWEAFRSRLGEQAGLIPRWNAPRRCLGMTISALLVNITVFVFLLIGKIYVAF